MVCHAEQDLVMTKDDVLIVSHDLHLDTTTDVAQIYPGRNRSDGRYYAIDFTWAEIRNLTKTSSFHFGDDGNPVPDFPGRFPLWQSRFYMNTFEEELQMVRALEKSMGRLTGIYPEIKQPEWHRNESKNISSHVLQMLKKYNYTAKATECYLQCFDAAELKIIRDTLMPNLGIDLNLVQLMPVTGSFEPKTMDEIAEYAQGVGPNKYMIVLQNSTAENLQITPLVQLAHAAGLKVHPWTFRSDQGQIPPYAKDLNDLFRIFYEIVKVDGTFTDFPDIAVNFLSHHSTPTAAPNTSTTDNMVPSSLLNILLCFAAFIIAFVCILL